MRRRQLLLAAAALSLAACQPRAADESATTEGGNPNADAKPTPEGVAFLEKNAKEPGVVTTPSGLQYKVIRSGPAAGEHPKPSDEVRVHYEGTLLDGTVFDSSYRDGAPVVFTLGNLIPGWVEGIGLMRPGDEWYLYIPPNLAYGSEDRGPIPGSSVLVFRIELLGVLPHSAAPKMG